MAKQSQNHTALGKRFECSDQAVFDILEGRIETGELRERLLAYLRPDSDEPAPVPAVSLDESEAIYRAWKASGIKQLELARQLNRSHQVVCSVLNGTKTSGRVYNALRTHLLEGKPLLALA